MGRREGDLGPVYGFQWRHFGAEYVDCERDYEGKGVDQLKECVRKIKEEPTDRRIILSAWNPAGEFFFSSFLPTLAFVLVWRVGYPVRLGFCFQIRLSRVVYRMILSYRSQNTDDPVFLIHASNDVQTSPSWHSHPAT